MALRNFVALSWEGYNVFLVKHPLPTKALTSGVICGSGDAACQLIDRGESTLHSNFDPTRTMRFTFLGTFLLAPVLHVWYGRLGIWIPGSKFAPVLKRLALDQLIFAPVFIPTFMSSLLILENGTNCTPELVIDRLRISWHSALFANWMIWVPANLVNFKFVPGTFQVLFANCVGFVWNAVLSFQASRDN